MAGTKAKAKTKTEKISRGDEVTVFLFDGVKLIEKLCTVYEVNNENNIDVHTEEGEKICNVIRKENLGAYAEKSTHFTN